MISFLINAIKIVFILGFLVFIHEGGHFIIAKLCKVKVNEFAIGFGPTIWSKQGKETKYALRLIPLGGFVSMEGEEERSEEEGSFSNASIPRRIAIVMAGGTVNIIFALIVYFSLMSFTGNNISNIVDTTISGYSAEIYGIKSGDKILKINNHKIRTKNDLDEEIRNCNGNELIVEVERNENKIEYKIVPTEEKYNYTGIALKYIENSPSTEILAVQKDSPAEKGGLTSGDVVLKINSIDVENDAEKLVENISKSETNIIQFTVQRNNEIKDFNIEAEEKFNYYLGINLKMAENNFTNNIYYAFWNTGDFLFSIIDNLKMLFTGNVAVNQLMGPVGIGEVVVETKGISEFVNILALISISLGVTNLLPFPPLDGGKVVILLIEGIRKKPLKENVELKIQMIGFCILIGLSIVVTYNDILRIF